MAADRFREGDALELYLYLVVRDGETCDRTYDPTGKHPQLEIYPPQGGPIIITSPTVVDSDDPSISAKVIKHTLTPAQTDNQVGRWEALVRVVDDNLTLGTARWECVHRRADTGVC